MQATVNSVLDFLVDLYDSGLGYSGINIARSMLSSFLVVPRDTGKEILIKKFLKGVFELRTPQPRYHSICDVSVVLDYIRTLGPNNELTLQFLTYKTVILTALISAQRVQTLSYLNLSHLRKTDESFCFFIVDKVKQTRPGHVGLEVIFSKYHNDERICVYSALEAYIEKTRNLRHKSNLFISYRKPNGPVGTETISRWIKAVLAASGVNTNIFKARRRQQLVQSVYQFRKY